MQKQVEGIKSTKGEQIRDKNTKFHKPFIFLLIIAVQKEVIFAGKELAKLQRDSAQA
jgi:hypothetical protein